MSSDSTSAPAFGGGLGAAAPAFGAAPAQFASSTSAGFGPTFGFTSHTPCTASVAGWSVPSKNTRLVCPNLHVLRWEPLPAGGEYKCDARLCGKPIHIVERNRFMSFACRQCNFDVCPSCV